MFNDLIPAVYQSFLTNQNFLSTFLSPIFQLSIRYFYQVLDTFQNFETLNLAIKNITRKFWAQKIQFDSQPNIKIT